MKTRAAIYARYSSHMQDKGTSIEVQLEQSRGVAGPHAREYIDRAVSGTTMRRPAFDQMIADAEARLIDVVYVYKYDRFGRSAHAHGVVADLEEMGVRVVSVTEGEDALARGIQLVVAEDYSRKLGERIRLSKAKCFEAGKYLGGATAFGYRVENGRVVIDPVEAAAVLDVFESYASGRHSLRSLARKLEASGLKPRRQNRWNGPRLSMMLRLPLYRGVRVFRDREVHDESLRIIGDELFERVRARNAHRRRLRKAPRDTRVFSGLLRCGECGELYTRRVNRHRGKTYPAQWVCKRRHFEAAHLCKHSFLVPEEKLLQRLMEIAHERLSGVETLVKTAVGLTLQRTAHAQTALKGLRKQAADLDKEINRLVEAVATGETIDPTALKVLAARLGERQRQRDALMLQMEELSATGADDLARVEHEVRLEVERARRRMLDVASSAAINAFLKDEAGELLVYGDGRVVSSRVSHPPARG